MREGLPRYFTGDACTNGHTAARYTSNRCCTECTAARRKTKTVDWNCLSPPQVELWYARISSIKASKHKQYRHHPLDETAVFCPLKKVN